MGGEPRGELRELIPTLTNRLGQKSFEEVGRLLSEAAEKKAEQLDRIRKEIEKLTEETVSSFRLAGDSYSNNYAFDHALVAYKRALDYTSRKVVPHLWAAIVTQIGKVYYELGTRIEAPVLNDYLSAAVDAYRQALEVQSQEKLWQDWARTQIHLGTALREQGARLGGEAGQRLLNEAILAYQQALEVLTRQACPRNWAQIQYYLAHTYLALGAWFKAAASFVQLLRVYPNNMEAYYTASLLYHEKLFSFEEAFSLSQQWLNLHPEDLEARSQQVEQYFTTARFTRAVEQLAMLLANPELEPQIKVPLQALEIAALLGLNKREGVSEKFNALCVTIASQPVGFSLEWTFMGIKHFVGQNEQLVPYRAWLLELFTALEEKDRNAILACLGEDIVLLSDIEENQSP